MRPDVRIKLAPKVATVVVTLKVMFKIFPNICGYFERKFATKKLFEQLPNGPIREIKLLIGKIFLQNLAN